MATFAEGIIDRMGMLSCLTGSYLELSGQIGEKEAIYEDIAALWQVGRLPSDRGLSPISPYPALQRWLKLRRLRTAAPRS